jgi:hypothetical protein
VSLEQRLRLIAECDVFACMGDKETVLAAADALREFCICAAIQLADGRIIRGHRHDDCIQTAIKWKAQAFGHQQGFMTSHNRFVGREEAMQLQLASGIESANGYRGGILFSEDLY